MQWAKYFKGFCWAVLGLVWGAENVMAQKTPSEQSSHPLVVKAQLLLEKGQWQSARVAMQEVLAQPNLAVWHSWAQYHRATIALKLFHPDGRGEVFAFLLKYPKSPESNKAYRDLGLFYSQQKNYAEAATWLSKTKTQGLSDADLVEIRFKQGYAHLNLKELNRADSLFNLIKDLEHSYTAAANYYSAYLNIKNNRFDIALKGIDKADRDAAFRKMTPQLRSIIFYRKRDYAKTVAYATPYISDTSEAKGKEEISMLLADAHYWLGNYKTSDSLFKIWNTQSEISLAPAIRYRVAYNRLQIGKPKEALPLFKSIAESDSASKTKDSLIQLSAYFSGVCYLNLNNKAFALSAFDQARKSNANKGIQSMAWFNYGKLLQDAGKFDEAIEALKLFANKFPSNANVQEAQEIISEAYLNTSDFDDAIAHIKGLGYRSSRIKSAFQKIAFSKGAQLFNENKFEEAFLWLDTSLVYQVDSQVTQASLYWAGQSLYNLNKYNLALGYFDRCIGATEKGSIYQLKAQYAAGYSKFNLKEYEGAIPYFKAYTTQMEILEIRQNYADALVRMGDCYYATKLYPNAIASLNKAIAAKTEDIDYAYFRKGMVHNGNFQPVEAKEAFTLVRDRYNAGRYYDDALYYLAQMDLDNSKYEEAISGFNNLLKETSDPSLIAWGTLRRALAYSNLKQIDKAGEDYKSVIDKNPTHPAAESAFLGLQELVASNGNLEEFNTYLQKFKKANPDNQSVESIQFETAKGLYFAQKYEKALLAFSDYLTSYPDYSLAGDARFYLAESQYRLGKKDLAKANYLLVLEKKPGSNKSIARLGELELVANNPAAALGWYKQLLNLSLNKKEELAAKAGVMDAYWQLNKKDSSALIASAILQYSNLPSDFYSRATLVQAKNDYQNGDFEKATDGFVTVLNNAKDIYGAESQYLLAEIQYKQGRYKESIETLFDLNKSFQAYTRWYDRSFLLIADNYIKLKENYQARYVLERLAEKSSDTEVKEQAKAKLAQLKAGS